MHGQLCPNAVRENHKILLQSVTPSGPLIFLETMLFPFSPPILLGGCHA